MFLGDARRCVEASVRRRVEGDARRRGTASGDTAAAQAQHDFNDTRERRWVSASQHCHEAACDEAACDEAACDEAACDEEPRGRGRASSACAPFAALRVHCGETTDTLMRPSLSRARASGRA